MKRILIHSTLALTLAATAAFAQQTAPAPAGTQDNTQTQQHQGRFGRHHQFDAHKAAQHLGKKLGLSDDQTAKLEPILADRQQKMQALHADTSLTQDQRREQAKSILKDSQTQLATVLTPDQLQQLKSMRRNGFRGRRGGAQQQQTPDSTTPPSV